MYIIIKKNRVPVDTTCSTEKEEVGFTPCGEKSPLECDRKKSLKIFGQLIDVKNISINEVSCTTPLVLLEGLPNNNPLWKSMIEHGLFIGEGVELLHCLDIDVHACYHTFDLLSLSLLESLGEASYVQSGESAKSIICEVLGEDLFVECHNASNKVVTDDEEFPEPTIDDVLSVEITEELVKPLVEYYSNNYRVRSIEWGMSFLESMKRLVLCNVLKPSNFLDALSATGFAYEYESYWYTHESMEDLIKSELETDGMPKTVPESWERTAKVIADLHEMATSETYPQIFVFENHILQFSC